MCTVLRTFFQGARTEVPRSTGDTTCRSWLHSVIYDHIGVPLHISIIPILFFVCLWFCKHIWTFVLKATEGCQTPSPSLHLFLPAPQPQTSFPKIIPCTRRDRLGAVILHQLLVVIMSDPWDNSTMANISFFGRSGIKQLLHYEWSFSNWINAMHKKWRLGSRTSLISNVCLFIHLCFLVSYHTTYIRQSEGQ